MVWFWALVACKSVQPVLEQPPAPEVTVDADPPVTIALQTRDNVSLVADYWSASGPGRPGVVLLHMTPRGPWTRADWPSELVTALHGHDWAVIAIDRRGAGDSQGDADDAFLGEGGRLDVEAAVSQLTADGVTRLALIGASNGTTSMVDFATWGPGEGHPAVSAMVYLSGGPYTENQTALADLAEVPSWFGYPLGEADWNVTQAALGRGSWMFRQWDGVAHGTQVFAEQPEIAGEIDAFLVAVPGF